MELIPITAKILHNPCDKFDFQRPAFDIMDIARQLVEVMYEKKGLGLAAPQVGIPYQIFAMRGSPENFVCINPRIIDRSNEEIKLEEGCLSYQNLILKIKRPRRIKVRFQTPNGEMLTREFHDLSARVFQHELDHLKGICFVDNISKLKLERAIKNTHYKMKDFRYEKIGADN